MIVTPESIEGAYSFLRSCKPFIRWKLPEADLVEFHAIRNPKLHGDYSYPPHTIRVVQRKGLHLDTFLMTVAHEMVHQHTQILGLKVDHGSNFKRFRDQICREFGWDSVMF